MKAPGVKTWIASLGHPDAVSCRDAARTVAVRKAPRAVGRGEDRASLYAPLPPGAPYNSTRLVSPAGQPPAGHPGEPSAARIRPGGRRAPAAGAGLSGHTAPPMFTVDYEPPALARLGITLPLQSHPTDGVLPAAQAHRHPNRCGSGRTPGTHRSGRVIVTPAHNSPTPHDQLRATPLGGASPGGTWSRDILIPPKRLARSPDRDRVRRDCPGDQGWLGDGSASESG